MGFVKVFMLISCLIPLSDLLKSYLRIAVEDGMT